MTVVYWAPQNPILIIKAPTLALCDCGRLLFGQARLGRDLGDPGDSKGTDTLMSTS